MSLSKRNHVFAPRRAVGGVKYRLVLEDRIWNYFVGWLEITQDPDHPTIVNTYNHFAKRVSKQTLDTLLQESMKLCLS